MSEASANPFEQFEEVAKAARGLIRRHPELLDQVVLPSNERPGVSPQNQSVPNPQAELRRILLKLQDIANSAHSSTEASLGPAHSTRKTRSAAGKSRWYLQEANSSVHHPLRRGLTKIGRDSSVDIVVDDPMVSAKHCIIEVHSRGAIVRDLGATNPTTVNGVPLDDSRQLDPGTHLRVGDTYFVLARFDEVRSEIEPTGVRLGAPGVTVPKAAPVDDCLVIFGASGKELTVEHSGTMPAYEVLHLAWRLLLTQMDLFDPDEIVLSRFFLGDGWTSTKDFCRKAMDIVQTRPNGSDFWFDESDARWTDRQIAGTILSSRVDLPFARLFASASADFGDARVALTFDIADKEILLEAETSQVWASALSRNPSVIVNWMKEHLRGL